MDFQINIDWTLLRQQKDTLFTLAYSSNCSISQTRALEGLICLLDHIQDSALYSKQATELEVFGTEQNIE